MGAPRRPAASLEPSGKYAGLAGRGMTSLVVADEVEPACDPLGGGNKLVLAPDRGGFAPASRISVGCKSPLSGGIAASHAVGPPAAALRRLGCAAVIVEGVPEGDDLWTIVIDGSGVSFSVDNGFRMLGNLETVAKLRRAYGSSAALLTIGQAGEMGLRAATATFPAGGARPTRHCGRGGAGAVMGSKRLKAIVFDGARAPAPGRGAAEGPRAARRAGGRPELDPLGRQGSPRDPGEEAGCDAPSPYREACGIRDPTVTTQLEALEDDLGLDASEVAAAIALAMEVGLARFGDGQAALRLVEEIARGTPLGRILGSGVRVTGDAFGLARARAARSSRAAEAVAGRGEDLLQAFQGVASARADVLALGRKVLAAERRFRARARSGARQDARRDPRGPHAAVFGRVDDDLERLLGALAPGRLDSQQSLPSGPPSSRSTGSREG